MNKVLHSVAWGSLLSGFVLGVVLIPATITFNHYTSTQDFCGNACHAMTWIVNDPIYTSSQHRRNNSGVVADCKDCHLPKGIVRETWAHIRNGSRDLIASLSNDFSEKALWELRRQALAHEVREKMIDDDSENCRTCHQLSMQENTKARVSRQHELANRNNVTCIQCHFNLVHSPVETTGLERKGLKLLPSYDHSAASPMK